MNNNDKGYVWPIAVTLLYTAKGGTGYLFIRNENIMMFVLMMLSFTGLMMNTWRKGDYIWSGEGSIASVITGMMAVFFSVISSINYYIEGTKYLGGTLSLILLCSYLFAYIRKAGRKEHPVTYISGIVVLIVFIAATVYWTIYLPKNEIAYKVECW